MEFLEKHPFLREIFFWISLLFVYGGAVNFSVLAFWPAVPFIFFVMLAGFRWEGRFLGVFVIIVMISGTLFFMKMKHGAIFHPALGRPYQLVKDVCFNKYQVQNKNGEIEEQIRLAEPFSGTECRGPTTTAVDTQFVRSGETFSVDAVAVRNINFEELYVIRSNISYGNLEVRPAEFGFLRWMDGRAVTEDDLRRPFFYWPARLMWWPKAPILFLEAWRKQHQK